ncbi:MAG: YciI family protein [Gemmatimonadales bacterium]
MKFLMLIRSSETFEMKDIPQALFAAMDQHVADGFKRGVLKDTAGLNRTSQGFRVRQSNGRITVTDGPFTETKEVVGGYAIMELASRDEALAEARKFMELHLTHWPAFTGECEVREIMPM